MAQGLRTSGMGGGRGESGPSGLVQQRGGRKDARGAGTRLTATAKSVCKTEIQQPRVPTCPGFLAKEGILFLEPTACPQCQDAVPHIKRQRARGNGSKTGGHTRPWRNRDKESSNGKDTDSGGSDRGRADNKQSSQKLAGQRHSHRHEAGRARDLPRRDSWHSTLDFPGLPTCGSDPTRVSYLAALPLGQRYQGPAPHGPREGGDQPNMMGRSQPETEQRRGGGSNVCPLPSHEGLSIRPVLGPLPSHAIHRQSLAATSDTVSPQILWLQCPLPQARCQQSP